MQADALTDQEWLFERVSQLIDDEETIDPDESLMFYGLDSIRVMTLAGELKERGLDISFEELARNPTLKSWTVLIAKYRAG